MAGATFSYGAVQGDFYLIRTDACGDTLWTRRYGTAAADLGHAVDLASDGGFAVAGVTKSFGAGGYDAWLVRTDSLGDTLWTRTFGGDGEERAFSVMATGDGGFALGGWTGSSGAGGADAWLIKTDSTGRSAIAEPAEPAVQASAFTTVARGVLHLPWSPHSIHCYLFDASGRPVLRLRPGPNDIRHLAAGAYLVRFTSNGRSRTSKLLILP